MSTGQTVFGFGMTRIGIAQQVGFISHTLVYRCMDYLRINETILN